MPFIKEDQVSKLELFPKAFSGIVAGEKIMLSFLDLEEGCEIPEHSHPHEQCGTVSSGEIVFCINGEERTLTAGDCCVIPGGVEHWATAGSAPAALVEVFSPVREEYKY